MAELRAQEGIEAPTAGKSCSKHMHACHVLQDYKGAASRQGPRSHAQQRLNSLARRTRRLPWLSCAPRFPLQAGLHACT